MLMKDGVIYVGSWISYSCLIGGNLMWVYQKGENLVFLVYELEKQKT